MARLELTGYVAHVSFHFQNALCLRPQSRSGPGKSSRNRSKQSTVLGATKASSSGMLSLSQSRLHHISFLSLDH
jgi:hypothetical protein